jgi:hypothetical protein
MQIGWRVPAPTLRVSAVRNSSSITAASRR